MFRGALSTEARLRNTVLERCQEKVRVATMVGRSLCQWATRRLGGAFSASLGHSLSQGSLPILFTLSCLPTKRHFLLATDLGRSSHVSTHPGAQRAPRSSSLQGPALEADALTALLTLIYFCFLLSSPQSHLYLQAAANCSVLILLF